MVLSLMQSRMERLEGMKGMGGRGGEEEWGRGSYGIL